MCMGCTGGGGSKSPRSSGGRTKSAPNWGSKIPGASGRTSGSRMTSSGGGGNYGSPKVRMSFARKR